MDKQHRRYQLQEELTQARFQLRRAEQKAIEFTEGKDRSRIRAEMAKLLASAWRKEIDRINQELTLQQDYI